MRSKKKYPRRGPAEPESMLHKWGDLLIIRERWRRPAASVALIDEGVTCPELLIQKLADQRGFRVGRSRADIGKVPPIPATLSFVLPFPRQGGEEDVCPLQSLDFAAGSGYQQ